MAANYPFQNHLLSMINAIGSKKYNVVIVCARQIEYDANINIMKDTVIHQNYVTGYIGSVECLLYQSGIGSLALQSAITYLIRFKPVIFILSGIASTHNKNYPIGSVVAGGIVCDLNSMYYPPDIINIITTGSSSGSSGISSSSPGSNNTTSSSGSLSGSNGTASSSGGSGSSSTGSLSGGNGTASSGSGSSSSGSLSGGNGTSSAGSGSATNGSSTTSQGSTTSILTSGPLTQYHSVQLKNGTTYTDSEIIYGYAYPCLLANTYGANIGVIGTASSSIASNAWVTFYNNFYQIDCADNGGIGFAYACEAFGFPFLIIRGIFENPLNPATTSSESTGAIAAASVLQQVITNLDFGNFPSAANGGPPMPPPLPTPPGPAVLPPVVQQAVPSNINLARITLSNLSSTSVAAVSGTLFLSNTTIPPTAIPNF